MKESITDNVFCLMTTDLLKNLMTCIGLKLNRKLKLNKTLFYIDLK